MSSEDFPQTAQIRQATQARQTSAEQTKRRVAFFGSPAFALPVLEAIAEHFEIVLVVSQPDKPVGRGLKMTPPPIAARAQELGLALAQPKTLKAQTQASAQAGRDFAEQLRESGAEVAVTCAYGKLLPAEILAVPRYGFLNTHTSLLPKYRGAAPIQRAIIAGETQTGTTIMQTDEGMDTGPILLQETLDITATWSSVELAEALSQQAARLIVTALHDLEQLQPKPQDHTLATHAPLLSKEDGFVRWAESSEQVIQRFLGVAAWPQTTAFWQGKRLKLFGMSIEQTSIEQTSIERAAEDSGAAQILTIDEAGIVVACGSGAVRIAKVQAPSRKVSDAYVWAKSAGVEVGMCFDV